MDSGKTKREIADDILAYLAHNPDAQDTLAGIVEWWLLEQELRYRTTEVREAIADLVQQGLISERKGEDGQVYYCVNKGKTAEISVILNKRRK